MNVYKMKIYTQIIKPNFKQSIYQEINMTNNNKCFYL